MRKLTTTLAFALAMGSTVSHADNLGRLSSLLGGQTHCEPNLYMQVEGTFLAPIADESGTGGFAVTDLDSLTIATAATLDDYQEDFTAAPRITLGYRGTNDWGLQFRYWELNSESDSSQSLPAPALNPANVSIVGGASHFEATTMDLELTRDMRFRETSILATFGARYAELDQGSRTDAFGVVANPTVVDVFNMSSTTGSKARGTGLTGSLSALRQLERAPAISLFASGRTSVLFGDAGSSIDVSSYFDGTAGGGGAAGSIEGGANAFFIGEVQAGLQWSRLVSSFNARMFARAAFEYQYWGADSGAVAAGATSGTGILFPAPPIPLQSNGSVLATADGFDNHLIGFGLSTGFVW